MRLVSSDICTTFEENLTNLGFQCDKLKLVCDGFYDFTPEFVSYLLEEIFYSLSSIHSDCQYVFDNLIPCSKLEKSVNF